MDQVVGITLRADAGGFVGEVRRASGAIDALDGQARTAAAGLDRAGTSARTAGRAADRGAEGFTALDRRLDATGTTMQAVQRAAAALGGALAVQQVVAYADAWTQAESRLRLVTDSSAELARRQTQLVDLANATRTALDPTVDLYTRLARSTDQLGASSADLLTVTRAVNQAVQVSGATAAEASAGIVQLGQGLASGALRGDELRSVMEQLPRLARAIADGLGVTIGELRDLGTEGALAAEEVFRALRGQADIIDAEFRQTRATVSQAFTVLSNATQQYIGEADQGAGATRALSGAILTLADNFEVAGDAILTAGAGLSGVLAVRGVAAFAGRVRAAGAALTTIAGAAGAARVALAALGGPIGVALSLGTAAAGALSGALSDTGAAAADAGDQARRLAAALEPARAATEAQTAAADDQTDATERMVAALERGQDVSRETVRAALEAALARRETLRATLDQIEALARLNRSVTDGISSPAAGVGAALAARARERRADVEANEENIERLTAQLDETARSARESASAAAAAGTAARAAGADFAQAGDDVRASASDLLAAERRARALAGAFEAGGDGARAQRARFLEASQTVRDWTATLRGAVDAGASQAEATAAVRGELAALARDLGASVAAGASLSEVQDALTRAVADSADVTARYEQRLESAREQQAALAQAQRSATEAVAGIAAEVENLAAQQAALDGGGLDALADRRALQRARDILGGLGREDLPDVVAALDAAGAEGDTLAERMSDLIGRKEDLSAAVQQTVTDLEDETEAQEDNATATRDAAEALRGRLARERALLALEASGASAAQIDARRAVLETENDLRERGIDLTTEQAREEIALTREIARTRRAREAVNTVIEDGTEATRDFVAAAIEGGDDAVASLRDSLVGGLRDILAEMAAQAVRQAVIVPVVQQAIGGGAGGGTGGGLAGSALGGLDPTGGALGDALGLGRSLGADLVPGGFGGINSAINGFGANLGFASGAGGGTLGASAGAPGFIGPNTSGLFGSTTLSGFLGGAGAGFGAGSFANSLVGGEGGQVGSGIGAAGGAAIGSVVPGIGTLAGGLIGGGLGGLISGLFGGGGKDFNLETAPTIDGLTAGAGRRETPFGFIAVQESGISGREFERGLTGQIAPLDQRVAQRLSASEIEAVRAAFAEGNGVNVDVGKEIDQSEIAQAIGDRFVTIFDAINAEVPDFLAKAARTGKEGNEEALEDALDEAFGILDFRAEFDARVRELTTGRPDSERLTEQVQQQIDNELTAIDNFLANVREAFPETITRTREAEVTVERVVNGRTGETREVTDTRTVKEDVDTSAESERRLAEAREASRAVLERLLGIRESETESVSGLARQQQRLEAVLARVQDPTSDLRETMDRLGVSASAAEASVAEQIAATEDRRAASLRLEAEGLSRVGDRVLAVSQGLDALRTEADAVGVSAETVADVIDRRFDAALSGVSRDQIPALIDVFEVLEGSIPGLDAALAELGERATEAAGAVSEATAESRRRAALLALEADGLRGAGARAVELAAGATRLADALATGQIDATQMAAILERRVGGALDLTATEAGALEQALAPLASDVPGLSTILDTLGVAVTEASDAVAQAAQRFRAAQQDAQQDIAQIGVDRTGIEAARDSGISRVREAGGSPAATQLLERLAGTTNTTTAQDVLDDISDFVGSAPSRSTFGSRLRAELEAVGATFDGDQAQVTLPNDDGGTTTASVDLSRSAQDIAAFLGQFDGLGDFDLPRLGGSEGVFAALSGAAARIFDAIEAVEAASARGAAERAAAQRREEARLAQTQVSNPDLFGSPKIDTRITAAGLRDTAVADVLSEINGSLDVEVARDFAAEILDVADSGDTAASAIGVLTDVLAASGQAAQTAAADFDRRAQAAQRAANSDIFGDSLTRQVVARGLDGGAFDGVLREAIAAAQDGDLDRDSAGRIGAVIQSIADSAEEAAPVLEVLSSALAESERVARERERAIADATQSRIREIEDATQAEVRAREDAVAAWRRATESLDRGLTRLRFDESVSPLGPTGRMEALRQEFEDTAQRALAGDPEAAAALETLSVDYLQDFREFSGDFGAFKAENERVRGILERVRDNAQQQITAEERQITEIEASAERQITAIEAASERQIAATEAAADRQAEAIAEALDRLGRPGLGDAARPETSGGSVEPIGIEEARARLSPVASDIDAADTGGDIRVQPIEADDGRNAFALLDSSGATLAVGGGPADTFSPAALAETAGLDPDRLQGFESGGMTPGGGEVVRIHNDELLFTGPPSRVFNAAESERLLSGGDNDTIVAAAERTTVAVGRVAALLGEANARLAALEERVGRQGEAIDNLRRASGQTNRLLEKRAA